MSVQGTAFLSPYGNTVGLRGTFERRCIAKMPMRPESAKSARCHMLSGTGSNSSEKREGDSHTQKTHIPTDFARQAMTDAVARSGGDIFAMAKLCSVGFCDAFEQCYSLEDISTIFFACGTGLNGIIGLHAAIELKNRGYSPAVHAPGGSKHDDMSEKCRENGIDYYDFIPSTLEFYFDVVVDALLGTGFDGGDIRPKFWSVYEMLISTRLAIVSVDVPSGWDLVTGPRKIDVTADTYIKPEVLVSLGAPKLGSRVFAGGYHFLAGRHLPQEYFIDRGISIPIFPGENANCVLISSNPFRFQGNQGEKYGRPGQYNATLFTKNPTREWVDVDEEDDLWDELD